MKCLKYFLILGLFYFSCTVGLTTYQENYISALDILEITCSSGTSENYVKCNFDNEQLCHLDGIDRRTYKFGYYTRFVTPGSSISEAGSGEVLGKLGGLGFFDPEDDYLDGMQIWFPLGPTEQSKYEYFSDLFSKKELSYNGQTDSNLIIIDYLMKEKLKHTTGSNAYRISSEHGPQDEGYFRIENVVIEEDESIVTFNFELHFECEMYYDPQYRPRHWRSLRNGIVKGSITTNKDK